MKRTLLFTGGILAIVLALAVGTMVVFAQSSTPAAPGDGTGYGYGPGMMGWNNNGSGFGRGGMMGGAYAPNTNGAAGAVGRGRMMGGRLAADGQEGPLHDYMVAAFAEKLGMSAEDLEARLDKGETMSQIANEKGLSWEQFSTLMTEARAQALDKAVADGKLTQEQADWMKQRGAGRMGGFGRGQAGCPYYTPTTTP